MQSPMMIAFVQSREKQWDQEQQADAWPLPGADPGRSRMPLLRIVLGLALLGALLISQLDATLASPAPTCSQTNVRAIRPDLPPPLSQMGKPCGIRPNLPPLPAEETDALPAKFDLSDLELLWAVVIDLLPHLAEVVNPQDAH